MLLQFEAVAVSTVCTLFSMTAAAMLFFTVPHDAQLVDRKGKVEANKRIRQFHSPAGLMPTKWSSVGVIYMLAHLTFVVSIFAVVVAFALYLMNFVAPKPASSQFCIQQAPWFDSAGYAAWADHEFGRDKPGGPGCGRAAS